MADPARIKYVAENFTGLQGLYMVAFGAALLAAAHIRGRWWPVGFLIIGGAFLCASIYLRKYYRWRFGWIKGRTDPTWWKKWRSWAWVALVWILPLFTRMFGYAEFQNSSLQFGIEWLALPFFFMEKDYLANPRNVYLVPITVGVSGFYLYQVWGPFVGGRVAFWESLDVWVPAIGLILWGVCDHVLLLRLMPKRISEDDHDG